MTAFSDLQKQYGNWQQSRHDYRLASVQFIRRFARRFREYLGAPEFYQTLNQPGAPQPYVSVVGVSETGEHTLEFKKSNSPFELLDQQEDGFWRTGIRLDLDRGQNEFPKANFFYLIKFVLRGNTCEMIFMNGEKKRFSFSIDDPAQETPIFEYMHGVVEHALSMPPWETEEKRSIGFLPLKSD